MNEEMDYVYYAAIDIGSNAVRLLVKRLEAPEKGRFGKVVMMRVPLRLGQEVFTQGIVSEKKASKLRKLMRAFVLVMKIYGVKKKNFRGCATAAMREAQNGPEVLESAMRGLGYDIEIIGGKEEASIACQAHIREHSSEYLLYVDVGGGSTEVSLIHEGQFLYSQSHKVGTVRMINNLDVAETMQHLMSDMEQLAAQYSNIVVVGAGGNINKLYALCDEKNTKEQTITTESLFRIYDDLRCYSVDDRALKYNLKPDRADVIVPAAEIFLLVAKATGAQTICVPSTGLADGIIEDLYRRQRAMPQQPKTTVGE